MTGKPVTSRKYGKGTVICEIDSVLTGVTVNCKADLLAVVGRNFFQVFSIHNDRFGPVTRSKTSGRLLPPTTTTHDLGVVGPSEGFTSSVTIPISSSTTSRFQCITDVAWSCANNILATGSTSGVITLWEVGTSVIQQKHFCGRTRSIHCIAFHPTSPTELVSASQDGKLKVFDTREPDPGSNPRTFIQRTTSPSPVRDVTYCPRFPNLFAAAQENGIVSIWDTRQHDRPYWAFQGHSCSIATLDWHPVWQGSGRNWLATAGAVDHLIKVWNFSQSASSQSGGCPSVIYTVRTSNASRVRWRPGFETQLVSTCNQTFDLSAYLWDLRRPYVPYGSFEEHTGVVTSISWSPSESDYFYTVGRDGLLIRHCVSDGLRPAESASPVALAVSVRGHLAHAVSRDRALAAQPSPVVDETNLVTQSPFYRALRQSSGFLSIGNTSSLVLNEGRPGFYAAPANSSALNLPTMGSVHSAELFVAQAQSLLFYFEPSIESLRHADWLSSCGEALVPDLIIALARHYVFVGPNVDAVCSHNARVALRFGQSFLVQFWCLLRSVYGNLLNVSYTDKCATATRKAHGPTHKPKQSPKRKLSLTHPDSTKDVQKLGELSTIRPVSRAPMTLRDMLCAIGVGSRTDNQPSVISPNMSENDPSANVANVPTVIANTDNYEFLPHASDLEIQQACGDVDLHEPDTTAAVSATIRIDRKHGSSPSKLVGSSSSTQLLQQGGLAMSVSSAHTCDSLGEPVDFLFHYPQASVCADGSSLDRFDYEPPDLDPIDSSGTNALSKSSPNPTYVDLIQALGPPDDPVELKSAFMPEEAFEVRHSGIHPLRGSFDSHTDIAKTHETGAVRTQGPRCAPVDHPFEIGGVIDDKKDGKSGLRWKRSDSALRIGPGGQHAVIPTVNAEQDQSSNLNTSTHVHLLAPFNTALGLSRSSINSSTLFGLTNAHLPDVTPMIVQWLFDLVERGNVQTVCTALLALGAERLRIKEWIDETRIVSWFMAYIELLTQFRLWTVVARIIKQCYNSKGGADGFTYQQQLRRVITMQSALRPFLRPETDADSRKSKTCRTTETDPKTRWKSGSGTPTSVTHPTTALAAEVAAINQTSTTLAVHCGRCNKRLVASTATQLATGHAGWACSRHTTTADGANATCALCHLTVKGLFVWCRGCSHGGHLKHMQEWLRRRSECPTGCGHRCEFG